MSVYKEQCLHQLVSNYGVEVVPRLTQVLPNVKDLPLKGREQQYLVHEGQKAILRHLINLPPQVLPGSLEKVFEVTDRTHRLLLDVLPADVGLLQFCRRNPIIENGNLVAILLEAGLNETPVPVVCPVCPDYVGDYQLSDGVGLVAGKAMNVIPDIRGLLGNFGFSTKIRIDVADVEAFDERILKASRETSQSYKAKVSRTISSIQMALNKRGLVEVVAGSMHDQFMLKEMDYPGMQEQAMERIRVGGRRIQSCRESLKRERVSLGDFSIISEIDYDRMVDAELASYMVYGKLVGSGAIILSADAMSATPAYNFFSAREDVSPVVYVKNTPNRGVNSLFE